MQMTAEKKTSFLEKDIIFVGHLKQIFGSSYFFKVLKV